MASPPSRRAVLGAGGAVAVLAVSGCDLLSTEPGGDKRTPAPSEGHAGRGAKEAPGLTEQVRAGKLPALKDRLPAKPLVVPPVEKAGRYGGTWHTALQGPADTAWLARTIGYDYLVRWNPGWSDVIPNVAESFEVAGEGREWTFRLRAGTKWSDGEPFTAADVVFAYRDVLLSEDIYPEGAPDRLITPKGEPAEVEAVDDHTVRFTFPSPAGMFLEQIATPEGGQYLTQYPRHYLEKFHKKYNPDIDALVKDAGLSAWPDLFAGKSDPWANADLPGLFGWQLTSALGKGTRITAERNPYYPKVDTAGRQLPYLDAVSYDVIDDVETMLLKATNGDFDFHDRHFNSLVNKPVLARNRVKGAYHFTATVPGSMNQWIIMLNLTHDDPALRTLFQNKDFRIGLSYAINREEMNKAVLQEQGEPWQAAPRKESEFYYEEFAKQYTEYDVDKANAHLDKGGYDKRDADGYRLRPDGQRIQFQIDYTTSLSPELSDVMELVKGYWRKVGVELRLKSEDRSLWSERVTANKHDSAVWGGDGGLQDAILYGYYYLPYHAGSRYAIRWYEWYSSRGKDGERPPAPARRQLELYDQVLASVDQKKRRELFKQILDIAKDEFYCIGTLLQNQSYGIVGNDFHGVPEGMPEAYLYPTPGPTRPEQYYLSDG